MTPAEVEHVVSKAEEYHAADGEKGTQELGKLQGGRGTREGGGEIVIGHW